MVKILREADEAPVAEIGKKHGSATSRSMPGASDSESSKPWT